MIKIQYFASIREALDRKEESLALPEGVDSIEALIEHLVQVNPHFSAVFNGDKKVLVAVNETIVGRDYGLSEDDEVAFFPPMTGG